MTARSLVARLKREYRISIRYAQDDPDLSPDGYDLLYVFFWGEERYKPFMVPPEKLVKEVASYRWRDSENFGRLSVSEFMGRYLGDCAVITTPARAIYDLLAPAHEDVYLCPNGIEPSVFRPRTPRVGELSVGWIGNPNDSLKGLNDVLLPSTRGVKFEASPGDWSRSEVVGLYQRTDVLAVASISESQPLPLIESMACGCFPVATSVGVVPELVVSGLNGLVVNRDTESFKAAFRWCADNLDYVRRAGLRNASFVRAERSWDKLAKRFGDVFDYAIALQSDPTATPPVGVPPARRVREAWEDAPATPAALTLGDAIDGARWRLGDRVRGLQARARDVRQRGRHVAGRIQSIVSERVTPSS
ncbi:glycosyltransferase [Rubrivirga sp.]|uniref:glycosyltransferase n=1 Tax=Rubrivirga sp. TaxID=1885344 RepID=UPI003C76881F